MKIKLIRSDEVVITRKEYLELLERSIEFKRTYFRVSNCQVSNCAMLNGRCPLLNKIMDSKKE